MRFPFFLLWLPLVIFGYVGYRQCHLGVLGLYVVVLVLCGLLVVAALIVLAGAGVLVAQY
jgi:hypothetical protein